MPANLSFDSYLPGLMTTLLVPNWLILDMLEPTSASSLLPGNNASTSAGVIPSLSPLMSGAPVRVRVHGVFSLGPVLFVWVADCTGAEAVFVSDCEPDDLYPLQAIEPPISNDAITKNDFMISMMP